MRVTLSDGHSLRLRQLAAGARGALARDRFRVVLLAGEGLEKVEQTREQIATTLGRSRQFVDQWTGRYRREGLAGLTPKPSGRRPPRLDASQREELCRLIDSGPPAASGRSVYFGRDIQEIIGQRFGKLYSLNGVYALLHRLGYSHLVPRPRHRKDDPEAREAFKKRPSTPSRRWKRPTPANAS